MTLTAVPDGPTSAFIRWVGAVPAESLAAAIVMDIHRPVTAVFGPRIEISSLADLAKIGNDPGYPVADALYVLTADIDASATAGWNDAGTSTDVLEGFKPIGTSSAPFTGNFDGQEHTISGLVVNRLATDYVGLFGRVGLGGHVRNLGLVGGAVTGQNNVGGLVGSNSYGMVSDCCATGVVTGAGTTSCSSVGGLVGINSYGTVSNCYATGAVAVTRSTGLWSEYYEVGGLVGMNFGTAATCYASGAVTGGEKMGGLVADNYGTVSNSYWDKQTSGRSSSAGGTGKATTEMRQQATFAGWDFADVWAIVENVTYPFLRTQTVPSDFNRDGLVNRVDLDVFTACVTGPAVPYDPAYLPPGCTLSPVNGFLPADRDRDGDVDQEDFGAFQRCYSGVAPADPACAG